MDFTFLTPAGSVAFFRSDAEQAEWCQDEMTVTATFPYVQNKVITRGMILLFQDPMTGNWQAFEIRTVTSYAYDMYQQITAESLAIAELSDTHIGDDIEMTDIFAYQALNAILIGSEWKVGNTENTRVSSGDISRGSIWQGITTIKSNWNVYITPRVTVDSTGITGRFLDVEAPTGKWRGVRLSINKNMLDPSVKYDDTELYTALYAYGASYTDDDDETQETMIDGITWTKTSEHPAKPYGQRYLEDAEKTALYGRNGKPRFGYYQNSEIDNADTLIEKTWQSLQQCSSPKINIQGTLTDLKRLGYADEPIQIHDLVIIDIEPLGVQEYRQIIKYTVDLLDPSNNTPEIGDYTPNIIYYNRETDDDATGGSSASAGGGTASKKQSSEFKTTMEKDERNINLNAQHIDTHGNILEQAGMYIDPITGVLIYAEDNVNNVGSKFRVQSDRITAEVTERKAQGDVLSTKITQTSDAIKLEASQRKEGDNVLSASIKVTASQIRSEVKTTASKLYSSVITQTSTMIKSEVSSNNSKVYSTIEQTATQIRSEVASTESGLYSSVITQTDSMIKSEVSSNNSTVYSSIQQNADEISLKVSKDGVISSINQTAEQIKIQAGKINLDGYVTSSMLESAFTSAQQISTDQMTISNYFTCLGYNTEWKSYTARFCSLSGEHDFKDTGGTTYTGRLVTAFTNTTLYYLGR